MAVTLFSLFSGQSSAEKAGLGGLSPGPAVLCWCQWGGIMDEGEGANSCQHWLWKGRGLRWGWLSEDELREGKEI